MSRNYRTPEQTEQDCLRHAERYERIGQPRNAESHRHLAAEQQHLAMRISAVTSVERNGGQG